MYHSRLVILRNMFSVTTKDLPKIIIKNKSNKAPRELCMICLSSKKCPFNEVKICFPNK